MRGAVAAGNGVDLRAMSRDIRRLTLEMTSRAKSSHVGSVFSAVEILATLYGKVLNVRPEQPDWPARDRFILSKGHSCAGLYAALALRGFFPLKRLEEFYVDGGSLYGHATHKGVPGVEVSTGSLGHGLALGVGLASGAQRLKQPWRIVALLSDGECDEGSTWEAALLAHAWKLQNLTAIIDFNKIQSLGRVEDVVPLEPFADKWEAFGWGVKSIDGHDFDELASALDPANWPADGRPRCVIANTVKGKGVGFMEDDLLWHYRSPQGDELARALAELAGGQ
jgi:transketolase